MPRGVITVPVSETELPSLKIFDFNRNCSIYRKSQQWVMNGIRENLAEKEPAHFTGSVKDAPAGKSNPPQKLAHPPWSGGNCSDASGLTLGRHFLGLTESQSFKN